MFKTSCEMNIFSNTFTLQVYNRAKAQSGDDPSAENVRDTMAPLLHLIRFPTMTRDEFISVVGL
jgi:hypothetical protein